MTFSTWDRLVEEGWAGAQTLYHEAFPHGRKPDAVIRNMFDRRMSYLHAEMEGKQMAAMAITGLIPRAGLLLLDYLAVRQDIRGQGVGRRFVRDILRWAREEMKLKGVILEAEADESQENASRIRFWERCGFVLTTYVHQYIWVPEPYRAMYVSFDPDFQVTDDGQSLFGYIGEFHKQAFRR